LRYRRCTKQQLNWKIGAYFTVEASYILPMVLMIFIIIIYLAFYLYDRCLFAQDSYILCYRESYVKNGGDRPEELRSRASRQFGTKYFALRGHSFQTAEENNGIIMQGSAFLIPRAFSGSLLIPERTWNIQYSAGAKYTDPPLDIRRYRRIRYIAARLIKAVSESGEEAPENGS
jgi:hypothetical protein